MIDIDYLVISDIHLGHKKTKTDEILNHLNIFFNNFNNKSQFTDLDIIFIAGDLFDRLLDFNTKDIHEATIWLSRLMDFCGRHDIKLRILEGTPSHDWKQSKILNTLKDVNDRDVDACYIDTLYIEHMSDLNINILYVPDEWTANNDLTFEQVKQLLKEKGLIEVDIAIMHGCFNYQVKGIAAKIDCHDENKYLNIVKYFINIGHFHSYSHFERIIAQGSFDRLSHGEEEPKGGVLVHIGSEPSFTFIENKEAKIYKTIKVRYKELDRSLPSLYKQLNTLPNDSYVRIRSDKNNPIYTALDEVKLKYPMLNFSKVTEESIKEKRQLTIDYLNDEVYTPISITSDNIINLLIEEITNNSDITDSQINKLEYILKETHAEV